MKKSLKKEYSISDLISKTGVFCDGDWVESKDQDPNGEVRLIQLADIGDGIFIDKSSRFLTLKKAEELKCTFLKKGDILIARMPDPIGRACIFPGSDQPCVTVVDVGIIRPENNNVHNEWLKYKINSPLFRHLIREYTTGTTRKRISRSNLNKITFELPIYSDQIKIAQILFKAEELNANRKLALKILDKTAEAMFGKMFSKLSKNNSKQYTLDELKIEGRGTFSNGPFGSDLLTSELRKSGEVPVIYIRDIRNGYFDWISNVYVTNKKAESLSSCIVQPGDVLFTKVGDPPGVSAIVPNNFPKSIITQDVIRLRPNPKLVNAHFLKFYINSEYGQWLIEKITVKGTRSRFPLKDFKNIKVNIPKPSLQKNFADFINLLDNLKSKMESSKNDLHELFSSLSQLAFENKLDLGSINIEQEELNHVKTATDFFAQQTKLLEKLAPLTKLQQTLDKITKSAQVFKSFESINKAFEVNKLPHFETLKRFEEFMVNSGIERLDEINSYKEYLEVMNQPIFKQLDIADKFRIKGLEHFHDRYIQEQEELERKQREKEARSYRGQRLDEEFLKTILEKDFKGPFKSEVLYEYLKKLSLDFTYDQFVNLIFELLRGKQPYLKQKYFETHIHEMAIPIMDLLPELQEAQKNDGLYLMLNKE